MVFSRRFLIALCCGAIAVSVGACQDDEPASAEKKTTLSATDQTSPAPAPAQKAETASRPTKKQTTRSREHRKGTASTGSPDGARSGQASTGTTAAEQRTSAKAERLARSGTGATEAPSTDSRRAQDSGAVDHWALYQQRKKKDSGE
jgi:hypothetical protein